MSKQTDQAGKKKEKIPHISMMHSQEIQDLGKRTQAWIMRTQRGLWTLQCTLADRRIELPQTGLSLAGVENIDVRWALKSTQLKETLVEKNSSVFH